MTLNEMKQLLVAEDLRLTKSLGQNFLHDGNQLKRIVAAAELAPADKVLEIGPGLGPLTERLLEQAGEVFAIEKDARLVKILQRRFATETEKNTGETPVLRLLHADALEYLQRETRDWSEWKLVSNLPYSVASPILVELAAAGRGPRRMVATLQIEVAKRLCAQAGSPDYGLLTLLVQLHYESRGWFKIPAGCFFPAPEVDSACVCLVRREQPLLPPEQQETFDRVARRSFSQRRKMMLKLLKQDWPEEKLLGCFERLQLSPQIRAEQVSLAQFAELAQRLAHAQNP